MGLPKEAIDVYRDYLKKYQEGDRSNDSRFEFTGFTSTSVVKDSAVVFTYQMGFLKEGQVPVLLVMDVKHMSGVDKAFLHDSRSSAFPKTEQEYLIGQAAWCVTEISEEELIYKKGDFTKKFPATVINLK